MCKIRCVIQNNNAFTMTNVSDLKYLPQPGGEMKPKRIPNRKSQRRYFSSSISAIDATGADYRNVAFLQLGLLNTTPHRGTPLKGLRPGSVALTLTPLWHYQSVHRHEIQVEGWVVGMLPWY